MISYGCKYTAMKNSYRPIPSILKQHGPLKHRSIRIRVSVALIKNNSIFLLKSVIDGKEAWFLPGGSAKWCESLEQAIKREINEELQINITISNIVGVLNVRTLSKKYHSVEIVFSGQTRKIPIITKESNEPNEKTNNRYSVEGKWFTLPQLQKINAYPKKIIKKVLSINNQNKMSRAPVYTEEELVNG